MKRIVVPILLVSMTAGCTATSKSFYENPGRVGKAALCRTFMETTDQTYKQDIGTELIRRGISAGECPAMVQKQNDAIAAGVALAAIGTAVAICANNNCGSGGYSQQADWDQFYNQYGQLVWVCREVYSGRFTYDSNCYGQVQSDWRWPSKSAV